MNPRDIEGLKQREELKAGLEALDKLAEEIERRVDLAHGYIVDAKLVLDLLPDTAHDLLDKAMKELRDISR